MLILVARYTFMFWLFIGSTNAEKYLVNQVIASDENLLRLSACTARCLYAFNQPRMQLQQSQSQPHGLKLLSLYLQRHQRQHHRQLRNQNHSQNQNKTQFQHEKQQQYEQSYEQQSTYTLEQCFNECRKNSTGAVTLENIRKIPENFLLKLVCRDDRSLTFRIDQEGAEYKASTIGAHMKTSFQTPSKATTTVNTSTTTDTVIKLKGATVNFTSMKHELYESHFDNDHNNKNINNSSSSSSSSSSHGDKNQLIDKIVYFVRMNKGNDAEHFWVYLSDENFITINNLTHSSTYNLTVIAVHANNEYSVITKMQQFETLRRGYTPNKVTDMKVQNFSAIHGAPFENRLTANIIWKPSADMTCHYNIICFSTESAEYDMPPLEIRNPRQLFTYGIENLTFSKEYKVGIRAKNTNNESKESELFWMTFRAPTCVEFYDFNFEICPPLEPEGLHVEKYYQGDNVFALNISWEMPQYMPDYYTLHILDLAQNGQSYTMNISRELHNLYVDDIVLNGIMYEVHLVAFTPGGNASTQIGDVTQVLVMVAEDNRKIKLISAIFAPIFCIVLLSLTTFIICHRRAKLKRYQERCKYFEELEKKAPIDPKATFDFSTKSLPLVNSSDDLKQFQLVLEEKIFFNDDAMEIERGDLQLHELLGEGAFGLVRRGTYRNNKSDEIHEVAVKMLKEQPLIEDVRAFRREIEVMKSVERHPNIVGIIGHCTKRYNELLLLTEYCSLGNLLDFLRDEWKYLHELQLKKMMSHMIQVPTISNKNSMKYNNNNNNENQCESNSLTLHEKLTKSKTTTTKMTTSNKLVAINKSYGYGEICTSSCKCKVDIISKKFANSQEDCKNNDKATTINLERNGILERAINSNDNIEANIISIKDCECKQLRRLVKNNHRNAIKVDLKQTACEAKPTKVQFSVDNKSYFKCLAENEQMNPETQKQQTQQQQQLQQQQNQEEFNSAPSTDIILQREPLSASDLLDIAKQVATGMEFLAKNKVVHRDLAARNVLVAKDRTIKIADFGLSRDIYQENIYKKTGNGKLPIKWLALESMTHQVYTTQSDVWSYGILLYEIVTLGGVPYPAIPNTNRLLHMLKTGYRMEKPKICGLEFYNLMASCWHTNPGERPTFTEIIKTIDKFMCDEIHEQQIQTAMLTIATTRREITKPVNTTNDDAYLKPL